MDGRVQQVSVQVWGRKFSGHWRIVDGEVELVCDWGVDREPLGTAQPEDVARRLLKETVLKKAR
ncbi:MAG: hypothetical protein ACHP7A_04325 [Caulobacterales bacterium]|jgi:hypothetical protein